VLEPGALQGVSVLLAAEPRQDQLPKDAAVHRPASGASDASAGALQGAVADAALIPEDRQDGAAERSADPAPDVPAVTGIQKANWVLIPA
jgi:hypothetical protein